MNFKYIKDKHAEKHVTPCFIHVLPLLNRHGWKQPVFKNLCTFTMLCNVSALCTHSAGFVVITMVVYTLMYIQHSIYIHSVFITGHYIATYINVCTYMRAQWKALQPLCSWSGNWPGFVPACWFASKVQWPFALCTAKFNFQKLHVLPTQCIYVFCVDIRANSDSFPIQY